MKKLFIMLACAAMVLILAACGAAAQPETVPPETSVATEPATETAAAVTEAPTELPTEPPLVLHSGLREDGSFDGGTFFIGDSLTYLLIDPYLMKHNYIGDARYTAMVGGQVTVFFDETYPMLPSARLRCLYTPAYENMTMAQAIADAGDSVTAVYIMLGTNFTPNASAETYIEICDYILEHCPRATIHLQTVPMSPILPIDLVNERIRGAYAHYQELGNPQVMLIDTHTAIGAEIGGDQVHMNETGKANWYQAILDHARENQLVQ